MIHKPGSPRADLLIIAIIVIAGLKFTSGLENALDIGLYDESAYLYQGVTLLNGGLAKADWAPLYQIWYFVLSLFQPNRIGLYYLNYGLLTILPPVLLYILLRRTRVSIPVSFLVSWFLLLSRANAYTWPRVSHLALILIILILILASRIKSLLRATCLASIGALLVSYVRPEYFLAYILSLLLLILVFVADCRRQTRLRLTGLTAYTLISILLLGALGLPLSGDRNTTAFGQHFSLHWVAWTGSDLNPWTDWQAIVSRNFGSAQSIWNAFAHNPSAFLKHITYNVWGLISTVSTLVLPVLSPTDGFSRGVAVVSCIGLCLAYSSNIRKNVIEHRSLLILVGLFLIPGILTAIVIYPRHHYLLVLCVLIAVLMAILLGSHSITLDARGSETAQASLGQLLLLGSLMMALTPHFVGQGNAGQPHLNTIRFIQSLRIEKQVNVLETAGGYHFYLGDNFHRVAEYEKDTDFDRFLQLRNINMIVVNDRLLKDSRFRDDPNWRRFLASYPTLGYEEWTVPHTDGKLLVRSDLLHR